MHEVEPADEDFQCSRCHAYAYLSHVIRAPPVAAAEEPPSEVQAEAEATAAPEVVCAIHTDDLGPGPKLLRVRFSDGPCCSPAARVGRPLTELQPT